MAKLTYLELVNRILRRITQTDITDVTDASGQALIIADYLNEAQNYLYTESNWYSLFTTRSWSTVTVTGVSNISFTATPTTISSATSAFGSFSDNQQVLVSGTVSNDGTYTIGKAFNGGVYNAAKSQSRNLTVNWLSNIAVRVNASHVWLTSTDGRFKAMTVTNQDATITTAGLSGLDTGTEAVSTLYYIWLIGNGVTATALLSASSTSPTLPTGYKYKALVGTVFNGADGHFVDNAEGATSALLTLQDGDALTTEANTSAVITAITYPTATDWGNTISLLDTTSDRILYEDITRAFDEQDPNLNVTGNPTHFAVTGDSYRLWPIASGTFKMRERYWKTPSPLQVNDDTSDLPVEAENALIYYALYRILEYQNKFDHADRTRIEFEKQLKKAIVANKNKIRTLTQLGSSSGFIENVHGISTARMPSTYQRGS